MKLLNKITFIDDKVLVLHLKFAHGRYFRYNHSIEIFSIDNQMVHTTYKFQNPVHYHGEYCFVNIITGLKLLLYEWSIILF